MTSFFIKLIAIFCMWLDHFNDIIIGRFTFLQILGRLTFPLFCFQIVVGARNTKSVTKYLTRMLIMAVIAQLPYAVFLKESGMPYALNVVFTLTIGLLAICTYNTQLTKNETESCLVLNNKTILKTNVMNNISFKTANIFFQVTKILIILALAWITQIIESDYKIIGVFLIVLINIFFPFKGEINILGEQRKVSKKLNNICFLIGMFIISFVMYIRNWHTHSSWAIIQLVIATFITGIIMLAYNGKKGPGLKYFFYIFYPAQFIILIILKMIYSNF